MRELGEDREQCVPLTVKKPVKHVPQTNFKKPVAFTFLLGCVYSMVTN